MKNLDKLFKLASRLEKKILKQSQASTEVDSTDVTMAVRPIVNKILEDSKIQDGLGKIVEKVGPGNISVGGSFVTNAIFANNKWQIDRNSSGVKVSGSLAKDPNIQNIVSKFNNMVFTNLEREFNRLYTTVWSKNSPGSNKITNHETEISAKSVAV